MAKRKQVDKMLDLLAASNVNTISEIDEQIAAKEAEIAAVQQRLGGELGALKKIRGVIDLMVNGRKPRKVRKKAVERESSNGDEQDAQGGGQPPKMRDRIVELLDKYGPLSLDQIAAKLATSEHNVRCSISKAKGKILWDDVEDKWKLAS